MGGGRWKKEVTKKRKKKKKKKRQRKKERVPVPLSLQCESKNSWLALLGVTVVLKFSDICRICSDSSFISGVRLLWLHLSS